MRRLASARQTAVRSVWTVADQGLSSITNFGVSIAIARTVSTRDFGAFAIVFTTYLFALGISRAIATEPLVVRAPASSDETRHRSIQAATGLALVAGATSCVLVGAGGLAFGGVAGRSLIALAVCLPGLLLQDSWRFAFFADGRPARAAGNDLVWAVAQAALLGGALVAGVRSVPLLVLAWGVAGSAAGVAGILQAKMFPRPASAFSWLRGNRDLNARFAAEFFVLLGTGQGLVFLLGSIAGLVAAGEFQAGQLLLGPITFVILSSMLFGVPELARRLRGGTHELKRVATVVSTATVLATAAWFVCAMLMPADIGHKLLGKSWDPARRLLPPLAIYSIASSASTGAACGIRALEAARSSLRLRLISMPVALGLAIPLIATHGSLGASWALAAAGMIMLPFWWRTFLSLASAHATAPVAATAESETDLEHTLVSVPAELGERP